MKKKVLYIQPIHPSGMDMLRERYDVIVPNNENKDFLLKAVQDVSAIVTRLTDVDRDIIEAGTRLEAIAKNGVGVDNIDVACANERNIAVLTTGFSNTWSVAEHTIFAMGAIYKKISYFDQQMHHNNWKCRDEGGFYDVEGRTLGIAGLGRIGQQVAHIASRGFRMNVLVFDPYVDRAGTEAMGYGWAKSMEDLCRRADVISLHMPLTNENTHIINDQTLSLMKRNAVVINFARGALIDQNALHRALSAQKIAGAALDAFTPEPPNLSHPLYQMSNVLLSPHTAGISEDARRRMSIQVAKGIDDVLSGKIPECCANKSEVYKVQSK